MLDELKNVKGFRNFQNFLKSRINLNDHWKAELHAIYEVNKNEHPLIEITSQDTSAAPEAIFRLDDNKAILEAKYIDLLFDANKNTSKVENIIKTYLNPLRKHISQDQSIAVFFDQDHLKDESRALISNACNSFKANILAGKKDTYYKVGITFILCNSKDIINIGLNPIVKNAKVINDYFLEYRTTGTLFKGINRTLENEVIKSLVEKRKQVKNFGFSPDTTVLYYFYINFQTLYYEDPAYEQFLKLLKKNEILVINNTIVKNGEYCEGKIAFYKDDRHLNLKNRYFK